MHTLSIQRPVPSIEMRMPASVSTSVKSRATGVGRAGLPFAQQGGINPSSDGEMAAGASASPSAESVFLQETSEPEQKQSVFVEDASEKAAPSSDGPAATEVTDHALRLFRGSP